MANGKVVCMWLLSVALVLGIAGAVGGGVSCESAVQAMIPCGSYLLGAGGNIPSKDCCTSLHSLEGMTKTPAARKQVCQCFKDSGPSFGVKPARAKILPGLCKITIGIPINPSVDCNKVS
ncbi:non-specific lipid-transfer protein [Amborella trichopoda]|uniref:non-specific lipid-transfer protein n=1 Tax=Amborella trichopoda TaxID=13333 RepID=UPI0005D40C34|nr:non-specific lipid-transfer protein [Amborella trichopoda]|eukprot:XP_011629171.1 non-specific lipid-transfer protein [Amborella trichopoda]